MRDIHFHGRDNWQDSGVCKYCFLFLISMIQFDFCFLVSNSVLGKKYNLVASELFFYPISVNPPLYLNLFSILHSNPRSDFHNSQMQSSESSAFFLPLPGGWREGSIKVQGKWMYQCIGFVHSHMSLTIDGNCFGWDSAPTSALRTWETQGYQGVQHCPLSPSPSSLWDTNYQRRNWTDTSVLVFSRCRALSLHLLSPREFEGVEWKREIFFYHKISLPCFRPYCLMPNVSPYKAKEYGTVSIVSWVFLV